MEQGSDEWFDIKKGKMSASHAQAISAQGKGLDTYIHELMSEYYSSGERDSYSNEDMERGIELEAQAVEMYELENNVKTEKVGFVELNEYVGCSPDRLVGEDGMIEVKCPKDKNHFKFLLEGAKAIESKYIWQMQMQMFITERKYNIFLSYNPNFKRSLFACRIEIDPAAQAKLKEGFRIGQGLIEGIKKQLND